MIPAIVALLGGSVLAVRVLWPAEVALERRRLARVAAKVATLHADLHPDQPGDPQ